jgi:hypothetical protein
MNRKVTTAKIGRSSMTERRTEISRQIVTLKKIFANHSTYTKVQELFDRQLEKRRAELASDVVAEARGIALIGASGSGKTTTIERVLHQTPTLSLNDPVTGFTDVVGFQVPSPATLKFVGETALAALGYSLQSRKTSMVIWGLVRSRLSIRRVLFLHLDEAQDLLRHQSAKELESVVRTLKSLMQNQQWPVALILSGMPELKDLLNHDPQLARRFFPVEFPRLHRSGDIDRVIGMVKFYAEKADLGSLNVNTKDFAARLIHAADCEFGLSIELVIAAIEEALLADSASLSNMHFAEAFKIRSGCIAGLNPFLADSFERIDARALLDMGSHS